MLCTVLMFAMTSFLGSVSERLRNEKVAVTEFTLKPGESQGIAGRNPALTVYFDDGSLEFVESGGKRRNVSVKRGEAAFAAAQVMEVRNAGASVLRFVRTEFLTGGNDATWGVAGLSPNYRLIVENRYTRTYEIRIPAGGREPQHTHKARVVICISGATLRHLMPDGREEPSTLKTGEVAWRSGGTHIGRNLGSTDLWVIAVEPK